MAGKVQVNGITITNPAVSIQSTDKVSLNDQLLGAEPSLQLWLYHKPRGVITSHKDPQGRPTVFDQLPKDMQRVVSVGRLDINSEGLLLLTNRGDFARFCELPDNKLMRRYKVRVFGNVDKHELDKLKRGCVVDGVKYGAIDVKIMECSRANSWLEVTLFEGKNREIRKVLGAYQLAVNRLIRVQYGPWELGNQSIGTVKELKIPRDIYENYCRQAERANNTN
jgi:23S rRNA pseudouridine2605 synthase